jgi:hypothetical protein
LAFGDALQAAPTHAKISPTSIKLAVDPVAVIVVVSDPDSIRIVVPSDKSPDVISCSINLKKNATTYLKSW